MKYDFDKPVNRRGTNCVKYDEMPNDGTIALWVADMDFETAPSIRRAVEERAKHGCFGYTVVPESFYESIQWWFSHRHGYTINRDSILYTIGIVPAVSAILKALAMKQPTANSQQPTAKVLVQTPAYNCFFSCVRNNGYEMAENRLLFKDGMYQVDWEDFEAKCKDSEVKCFILCNPQNPTGRVWTKEELTRMGEICARNNVFVIADEIHCEFTSPDHPYTPFASLFPHPSTLNPQPSYTVCLSPSKAFNIAGLQIAVITCEDAQMRQKIDRAININEVCDVNPFGVLALQAAYTPEGEEWLNQLNVYIRDNYAFAKEFIEKNIPHWDVLPMEGTYLMWVDISKTNKSSDQLAEDLLHRCNVYVNCGTMYDKETGKNYIRINLAIQRSRLQEALRRISTLNH